MAQAWNLFELEWDDLNTTHTFLLAILTSIQIIIDLWLIIAFFLIVKKLVIRSCACNNTPLTPAGHTVGGEDRSYLSSFYVCAITIALNIKIL